jgi:hypothetical protein
MDAHSPSPAFLLFPPRFSPSTWLCSPLIIPLFLAFTLGCAEEASQRRALREEQRAAQAGTGTGDLQADGTWDLSNDDQQFVSTHIYVDIYI